jgi:hypothetical protein
MCQSWPSSARLTDDKVQDTLFAFLAEYTPNGSDGDVGATVLLAAFIEQNQGAIQTANPSL